MTRYDLASRICRLVTRARLDRIGQQDIAVEDDPLASMSEADRQPWLDTAAAFLAINTDLRPVERLQELGRDWISYTMRLGHDPQWRDEMRRAVVIEMQAEVAKLAKECDL